MTQLARVLHKACPSSFRMEGSSSGGPGSLCHGVTNLRFLAEAKLSGFWQLVTDEKKQIFTSEKFLLSASEDGEFLGAKSFDSKGGPVPDHLIGCWPFNFAKARRM
jgi:hypothetical protein